MDKRICFPINTNYPYPGMGKADTRVYTASYNSYNAQTTDDTAPEEDQVIAFIKSAEQATAEKVVLLNDIADLKGPDTPENLLPGQKPQNRCIQIVNNLIVGQALFTVAFPPGWDPNKKYPIILSGNGSGCSNNCRLYTIHSGSAGSVTFDEPAGIAYYTVLGTHGGGNGFISAVCNCGGRESQGANTAALQSAGSFINLMATSCGGDRNRVITYGSSRGGGTALLWAANPLNLDYNVIAVFANVPPLKYGSTARVPISNFPSLARIMNMVLNDPDAYRYDAGPCSPLDPSPVLKVLVGTNDLEKADMLGPWGYFERLAGKQVVISQGTHDTFMPLPIFLEADRRLRALGINTLTIITLRQGHGGGSVIGKYMKEFLTALSQGKHYTVPSQRIFMLQTDLVHHSHNGLKELPLDSMPFTVNVPWKLGTNDPGKLILCGEQGKAWTAKLYHASERAYPFGFYEGIFDETESAWIDLPCPRKTGSYVWEFTYDGVKIPSTNTPVRDNRGNPVSCVTHVVQQQPQQDEALYDAEQYPSLSFGIDQY